MPKMTVQDLELFRRAFRGVSYDVQALAEELPGVEEAGETTMADVLAGLEKIRTVVVSLTECVGTLVGELDDDRASVTAVSGGEITKRVAPTPAPRLEIGPVDHVRRTPGLESYKG